MIRYVNGSNYGYKDGKLLVKAQLECDELEELPAVDFFEGKLLDSGSQCWVIGTGDLYGLTSTGDWVKVNFMGNGEGGDDGSAYAHSLELTIDSQTYVMTATLKNTSSETLGTPQTIDLPLETMVVGGSYDDITKKVILTLKNGNTVDFSVADLVSGLQSEITSTNKLNSDLVDDTNQNNKFVTSVEKTKIANALTEEVYNAGKTTPYGTQYVIEGETYTVKRYAEIFNSYANNKAIGEYSHAEGQSTIAGGDYSHSEGSATKTSGASSHAEGYKATASGQISHAEGSNTKASGSYSHAEGDNTIAASARQHVQGKYNIEDSNSKYAFIIGNGTDADNRSNAFAVDWDGKIYVNNAVTGVDVSTLQSTVTDIQTTIGNINAVLEEVL